MTRPETPPTGGPTKDEILAISLQKLGLESDDIFADIGCGTGKVTLHAARRVRHVHAVDMRESAYLWTKSEIEKNQAENITLYYGDAVDMLTSLDHLDTAFIGGSQRLEEIIRELSRLRVRSLVINAVMLETLHTAIESLRRYNLIHEVIQVQISKSVPIAGGIMLKPLDPIFIIHGGINKC